MLHEFSEMSFAQLAVAALLLVFWTESSEAKQARCAVFENNQKIDDEPCDVESYEKREFGNSYRFIWPSGGKTYLSNIEEFYTINGEEGESLGRQNGFDICVLNRKTKNTFCYSLNSEKQIVGTGTNIKAEFFVDPFLSSLEGGTFPASHLKCGRNGRLPEDGMFATLTPRMNDGKPVFEYRTDEHKNGQAFGLESVGCELSRIKSVSQSLYSGRYRCNGEGMFNEGFPDGTRGEFWLQNDGDTFAIAIGKDVEYWRKCIRIPNSVAGD